MSRASKIEAELRRLCDEIERMIGFGYGSLHPNDFRIEQARKALGVEPDPDNHDMHDFLRRLSKHTDAGRHAYPDCCGLCSKLEVFADEASELLHGFFGESQSDPVGERCDDCGRRYLVPYLLSDATWAEIHERAPAGLLCSECAYKRAEAAGVAFELREAPMRARVRWPCGCVPCICEDEDQCHGCGATSCSDFPHPRPEPEPKPRVRYFCMKCGKDEPACECHYPPDEPAGTIERAREAFTQAALAEMDPANRPHNEHDHDGADRFMEIKRRKREAYEALIAAERAQKDAQP